MFKVTKRQMSFFTVLFIVWILLFLVFFGITEISHAIEAVLSANVKFIFISLGIFILAIFVSVSNIDFLMEKIGRKVRFINTFKIILTGYFIDNLLPNMAPGGEVTMAYLYQNKEKIPLAKGFSVIIFYTIGWFLGFTFFVISTMMYLLFFETYSTALVYIMLVLLLCFMGIFFFIIYIITKPKSAEKVVVFGINSVFRLGLRYTSLRVFQKKTIKYAVDNLRSFAYVFRNQRKRGLVLFSSMMMFIHHLLVGISFFMVLVAFNVEVSLFYALGLFIIISMISLLSMIPGQFGIYELVAIPLVSLNAGLVNGAVIIAVVRLIHYWSIIFIGGSCAVGMCVNYRC